METEWSVGPHIKPLNDWQCQLKSCDLTNRIPPNKAYNVLKLSIYAIAKLLVAKKSVIVE